MSARAPSLPGIVVAAALSSACAPTIAEQVARGEWHRACRRADSAREQAELERALWSELAAGLTLDLQVFDRPALTRELGVPVEGTLAVRVLLVRFAGELVSSRLQQTRVELIYISDGDRLQFGPPAGVDTPQLSESERRLYTGPFDEGLSDLGIAALLLAPTGEPGSPDALKPRLVDGVPIPLSGGDKVGKLRQRWHRYAVEHANRERYAWETGRAKAMRSDPTYGPAAALIEQRLTSGQWSLLLPAYGPLNPVLRVRLRGTVVDAGDACDVWVETTIALPGSGDLSARVDALFAAGPRRLAELPWRP